jgi:hypothetical protein
MPTGFDKFKKKTLSEGPIMISKAEKGSENREEAVAAKTEVREAEVKTVSEQAPATAPVKKKKEVEDLVPFNAQMARETKKLLDEMKFRSGQTIRELIDEAVKDLYKKMYR